MHVFVRSDAGDVSFRVRCLWVRVRFFDVRGGVSLLRSFQVRSHRRPTRGRFVRQRLRFRRHESSTARHGSFVSFLLGNRSRTSFLCVLLPRFVHTSSNGSVGSSRRRRRRCFFFFRGVVRVVVSFVPVRRSGFVACASVSSSFRWFRLRLTWVCLFLPSFFVSGSCRFVRFVSHHVRSSSRWVARLTSSSHSASTARTSSSLAPVTSIILSTVFFLAFPPSPCALLPPPPPSLRLPFSLRFVAMVVCNRVVTPTSAISLPPFSLAEFLLSCRRKTVPVWREDRGEERRERRDRWWVSAAVRHAHRHQRWRVEEHRGEGDEEEGR